MRAVTGGVALLGLVAAGPALAWGNEGHEVVALIAQGYLTPKTLAAVNALLAQDDSPLTAHTLPAAATWADAFRASSSAAYTATHQWHFADIALHGGTLSIACFGFPALPAGAPASAGPARDCHVDKINEATAELKAGSSASTAEKILALKYLLHFVGDLHQPLHSSNDHDSGGNAKNVSAATLGTGNLHSFWDTHFVALSGTQADALASQLKGALGLAAFNGWYRGTPNAWAEETYALAVSTVYGSLPAPNAAGVYELPASYVQAAQTAAATQLTKAGVRLAYLLNQAFDPKGRVPKPAKGTQSVAGLALKALPAASEAISPAFIAEDQHFFPQPGRDH